MNLNDYEFIESRIDYKFKNRDCAPSKGRMIEQVGILHGKG